MTKQITMQQIIALLISNGVDLNALVDFLIQLSEIKIKYSVRFASLRICSISFEIYFEDEWLSDMTYSFVNYTLTDDSSDRREIKARHKDLFKILSELKTE